MAITVRASAANRQSLSARLNWLRAGVLGANDGIVSTAGLVLAWPVPPQTPSPC